MTQHRHNKRSTAPHRVLTLASLALVSTAAALASSTRPESSSHSASILSVQAATVADLGTHTKPTDCWTLVSGTVYDITGYIKKGSHPGGATVLAGMCGKEGKAFLDQHSTTKYLTDGKHAVTAPKITAAKPKPAPAPAPKPKPTPATPATPAVPKTPVAKPPLAPKPPTKIGVVVAAPGAATTATATPGATAAAGAITLAAVSQHAFVGSCWFVTETNTVMDASLFTRDMAMRATPVPEAVAITQQCGGSIKGVLSVESLIKVNAANKKIRLVGVVGKTKIPLSDALGLSQPILTAAKPVDDSFCFASPPITKAQVVPAGQSVSKAIAAAGLPRYNTTNKCYVQIGKRIIDFSLFKHCAAQTHIASQCGKDATAAFAVRHTQEQLGRALLNPKRSLRVVFTVADPVAPAPAPKKPAAVKPVKPVVVKAAPVETPAAPVEETVVAKPEDTATDVAAPALDASSVPTEAVVPDAETPAAAAAPAPVAAEVTDPAADPFEASTKLSEEPAATDAPAAAAAEEAAPAAADPVEEDAEKFAVDSIDSMASTMSALEADEAETDVTQQFDNAATSDVQSFRLAADDESEAGAAVPAAAEAADAAAVPAAAVAAASPTQVATTLLTEAALAHHDSAFNCWVLLYDKVLDVTKLTSTIAVSRGKGTKTTDPGAILVSKCGGDISALYNALHTYSANEKVGTIKKIGTLVAGAVVLDSPSFRMSEEDEDDEEDALLLLQPETMHLHAESHTEWQPKLATRQQQQIEGRERVHMNWDLDVTLKPQRHHKQAILDAKDAQIKSKEMARYQLRQEQKQNVDTQEEQQEAAIQTRTQASTFLNQLDRVSTQINGLLSWFRPDQTEAESDEAY